VSGGARYRRVGNTCELEVVDRHRALGIHAERYPAVRREPIPRQRTRRRHLRLRSRRGAARRRAEEAQRRTGFAETLFNLQHIEGFDERVGQMRIGRSRRCSRLVAQNNGVSEFDRAFIAQN